MSKLATREISIFELVSVAVEASMSLTLLEIPKTGFLAARPNYKLGNLRSVRTTCSCLKIFNCIKYITILLFIASVILCAYSFNTLFLRPAKRSRQSSIYSPTSMDYSWGGGGRGGGVMSHAFEPLYSFVEIISDESI